MSITTSALLACLLLTQEPQSVPSQQVYLRSEEAMKGIVAIGVVVEDIRELQGNLTAQTLKTNAELRLRQTGINVLNTEDGSTSLAPQLYINCNVLKGPNGLYVYNVSVQFQKTLITYLPSDDKPRFVSGTLWSTSTVGYSGGVGNSAQAIRQSVDDKISEFLNNYLAVNPRR